MRLRPIGLVTVFILCSVVVVQAMSLSDMREWLMKTNGFAMLDLKKILEQGAPFDSKRLSEALDIIEKASRDIPKAFPAGSEHVTLAASPAIWEKPEDFQRRVNTLVDHAQEASGNLPKTTSRLTQLLNTLSSDCSDCHKTYRLKE